MGSPNPRTKKAADDAARGARLRAGRDASDDGSTNQVNNYTATYDEPGMGPVSHRRDDPVYPTVRGMRQDLGLAYGSGGDTAFVRPR